MKMVPKNKDTAPKPHTIAYACQKLGVSKPSIYDLIRAGKLRTYKVGDRGRRVSDEAISDCIRLLEAETAQGSVS
jgi:excisionase family DNA binding protein